MLDLYFFIDIMCRTKSDMILNSHSPIAQSVEQWTVNPCVPGSSPGWRANQDKHTPILMNGFFYAYFLKNL